MSKSPTVPALVEQSYQLWRWLDGPVSRLPVHARATLGRRLLDTALDILDALLVATYTPRGQADHAAALRTASQRAALLRFLLRAMRDSHHLSLDQHAHAAAQLDAIGRAIGGWQRRT